MHKSSFIEGFYKTTVLALAAGKDIIISMEKYGVKQVNRHPRHKVHSDLNGTTLHTKSNASSQLAFSLRTHLCVCCPHISAVNKHPIRIHWPPERDKSLDPPPSHTRELHNHEVMVTQTPEELLLHASRWLGEASKGPPPLTPQLQEAGSRSQGGRSSCSRVSPRFLNLAILKGTQDDPRDLLILSAIWLIHFVTSPVNTTW